MRSKTVSLLAAAFSLGVMQAASAADMPVKAYKAPVAAPAAFSWTGCYIGAHGGYGWGRNTNDYGTAIASGASEGGGTEGIPSEFGPFDHKTSGGVLGGQAGCNYQFQQNWVVGVEGEFAWSGIKGSVSNPDDEGVATSGFESRIRWTGDLAARFGYAWDRHLLYGKVGAAWGSFRYTETHDDFPTTHAASCGGGLAACSVDITNTRAGLLLGVGWEYAWMNNWSVKAEYNHINYGTTTIAYPSTTAAIQSFQLRTRLTSSKLV
jgi:outer membrane immunogenic protein